MLNNRELAALIWVGAAAVCALSTKSVREGFVGVVKAFLQLLIPLAAMLGWVSLELWVGVRLAIWNSALAKGTILWTLGSAGALLFNCTQLHSDSDPHFFRRTVLATVGVTVFVEFFVNLYAISGSMMAPSRQWVFPSKTLRGATDRSRIRSIVIGGDGADSPRRPDGHSRSEAILCQKGYARSRSPRSLRTNSCRSAGLRGESKGAEHPRLGSPNVWHWVC